MKMNFQKVNGEKIKSISQYVKDYINADTMTSEFQIMIGCDSLPKRFIGATYVTVVCIYRVGRGAHLLFTRETRIKTHSMKERLWGEVYRAVEVANELSDNGVLEMNRVTKFEIHLDFNPNERYESNVIHDEALGYLHALGFDAFAKPDSPAASFASDRVCRNKERIGVEYEVQ